MADTKELRADAPSDLVCALDALALSHGKARTTYMVEILEKHVKAELHRVTIVTSMLKGNPLLSDTGRTEQS